MTKFLLPGDAKASHVLSGKKFNAGTEYNAEGTMPDRKDVTSDAVWMAIDGADIYLNTPEGYYNPASSIRYRENTLADPKNWRADRTMFGKQGAMPVRPAQQAAMSMGENSNVSNVYARIPLGAYMSEVSPGTAEIVIPYSMLANNASTKIRPEHIRSGVSIYGVQGTLQERQYASGYAGNVGGGDGNFRVTGLGFKPRIVTFYFFRAYTQSTLVFFSTDSAQWVYVEYAGTNPFGSVKSTNYEGSPEWGSDGFGAFLPYLGGTVNINWQAWR